MNKRAFLLFFSALAIFLYFEFYPEVNFSEESELKKASDSPKRKENILPRISIDANNLELEDAILEEQIANPYKNLITGEFDYLQVDLPEPDYGEWILNLGLSSIDALKDTSSKLKLLGVLGMHIRLSLRENPTLSPKLLGTLITLLDDDDMSVSIIAISELYRLGDYQDFALKRIQGFVSDTPMSLSYKEVVLYHRILNDLEFYDDNRVDHLILQKWDDQKEEETGLSNFVDYGYYLEKNEIKLPIEYWIQRIQYEKYWEHSIAVLENRKETLNVDILNSNLDYINEPQKSSYIALMYQVSKDQEQEKYLEKNATKHIDSHRINAKAMTDSFKALAKAGTPNTISILSKGLDRSNILVRRSAAEALGNMKEEEISNLLYESAVKYLKIEKRFPRIELDALIKQNTEIGDLKFVELKTILMDENRNYGPSGIWSTTDFHSLEFFKKYLRNNANL